MLLRLVGLPQRMLGIIQINIVFGLSCKALPVIVHNVSSDLAYLTIYPEKKQ